MNKLILLLAATFLSFGCGTVATGGTGAGTGSGGSTGAPCPVMEPIGGASCAGVPAGRRCTYGSSVRPECRDVWICNGSIWQTTKGICPQPPPGECGTTQPAQGTVCPTTDDVCTYQDIICICSECPGGPCMTPPPKWSCAPPPAAGCPAVAPNDGTACSMNGLSCTYGFPCSQAGAVVDCKNGTWVWDLMIGCPV
jgi:hypothetical protein